MRFDWKLPVLAICFGCLGCADFHGGPAPRDAGADAGGTLVADLTFEMDVYRILQSRCQDCHEAGGRAEYTRLVLTGNARMDRAMVVALVVPGDPSASLLLLRATGEAHSGGSVLSPDSTDYTTIANWIFGLPLESRR
jgi:hypothetical protein